MNNMHWEAHPGDIPQWESENLLMGHIPPNCDSELLRVVVKVVVGAS